AQDLAEGRLERPGARVPRDVVQLPRILLQVVELAPPVLVLDVEVSPVLDGDIRRRAAVVEHVLPEVLDEEVVAPRNVLAAEKRKEAAAVLWQAGRDPCQRADRRR